MYGYTFYEIVMIFLFWGITGWLIEVIDMKIEAGELQNRGFLHMPICPLYGIGMLFMCMIFREGRSAYAVLFAFGIIVGSLVEYLTGWLLEKLFHTKWWDYSHMRFQVKGRVCLRNSILFGFGAILTIGFIQPAVEQTLYRIPPSVGTIVVDAAVVILVIDTIVSVIRALQYRGECDGENLFVVFKSHR